MRRPILRRLAVVAALALAACNEDGIGTALADTYGPCWVDRSDDGHLEVVFMDSPFASRPEAERAATARKVALYVRDHDPHYKGVKDVQVAFQTKKETAANEFKHIAATYTFTHDELGP